MRMPERAAGKMRRALRWRRCELARPPWRRGQFRGLGAVWPPPFASAHRVGRACNKERHAPAIVDTNIREVAYRKVARNGSRGPAHCAAASTSPPRLAPLLIGWFVMPLPRNARARNAVAMAFANSRQNRPVFGAVEFLHFADSTERAPARRVAGLRTLLALPERDPGLQGRVTTKKAR